MRIITLLLFLVSTHAYGIHTYLGAYKMLEKTQDDKGKHADNPFNPMIGVGANFKAFWGLGFSPQLAYIHHFQTSDDSYGGKYTTRTVAILYDFLWVPGGAGGDRVPWAIRFGLGNFIKKIKGKGGKVTVPNGATTVEAHRPGKEVTTYSGTFNLGADLTFPSFVDWFQTMGARFETFTFSPLNQEKRTYAFNLVLVGYF